MIAPTDQTPQATPTRAPQGVPSGAPMRPRAAVPQGVAGQAEPAKRPVPPAGAPQAGTHGSQGRCGTRRPP